MYDDEKTQKIIDNLIDGTKIGYIVWKLDNSIWNNDTRYKMIYESSDGLTVFNLEVTLDNSLLCVDSNIAFLYIHNDDLINRNLQVSSNTFENVKNLQKLIFSKFVKQISMKKAPKVGTLDSILGNINKQHHRQEKIDDILEDTPTSLLDETIKLTTSGRTEAEVIEEFLKKYEKLKEEKTKKRWWHF